MRRQRELRADAIQTANGKWTLVSREDLDYLRQFKWHISDNGYVLNRSRGKTLRMHRIVMERVIGRELAPGEVPDHKYGDRLDNRRSELRLGTRQDNLRSSRRVLSKSGYRYVERHHTGKWTARVSHIYICVSDDIEYAAWMADQWAVALYGEFAITNFEYV